MSIKEIFYVNFFDHACVGIQDDMKLLIVPADKQDNILPLAFSKSNYKLEFSDSLKRSGVASVRRGTIRPPSHHVELELNYIATLFQDGPINEFIITGNEIDEFFSPIEHYFSLKHGNNYKPSDLLYGQEIALSYQFVFEHNRVDIALVFGNILRNGKRSDLMIHPQLVVHIEKPQDLDFVFRISKLINTLLQFVLRKQKLNLKALDLFTTSDGKKSYAGYLFSSLFDPELRPNTRFDASFRLYGKKLENLLSLISFDKSFPVKHLNENYHSLFRYTTERFSALCSAFEHECSQDVSTYIATGCECDEIRKKLISLLKTANTQNQIEQQFQSDAIERVQSLGTQHGFRKKIIVAYQVNEAAFRKSIDQILVREKSIEKIARQLSSLRGKILHSEMGYQFDDQELEAIEFLEILQFVMTLRRAKYLDSEIEIIIGALYYCNGLYWDL